MKIGTILSMAFLLIGGSGVSAQNRPNVLFIMTDQQSHDMMSCAGNSYLSTPNMDRIAARGYRFDKTYSVNPVCSPTRFSFMTGHYASEVGIKENIRSQRPSRFDSYAPRVAG